MHTAFRRDPGTVKNVQSPNESGTGAPPCVNHPQTPALTSCQRCANPICGQCMIEAPVGYQCPACVAEGTRRTRTNELPFGGTRATGGRSTTSALLGINVAVWLAISLTGGATSALARLLALVPAGQCLSADLVSYFPGITAAECARIAEATTWVPGVADGAWWQLLTSGFTHVQIWHLGTNMLVLWFIGPAIEQILGRARYLVVYLLSLLGGSVAVMWFASPASATVGASGAIFGLLGTLLILAVRGRGNVRGVLMWIGLNLLITVLGYGHISWQGHIGGLAVGLATAAIIVYAPKDRAKRDRTQWLLLAAVFVVLTAATAGRCLQLV